MHVHTTSRYVWEKSGSVIDVSASPRLRQDPDGTLHISQTWSGDIGTYTCRVTSVGGNDSRSAHLRVRYAYLSLLSYLALHFFLFFFVFASRGAVMDGCFLHCLWFITALLSNPSNTLIFTRRASRFGCLILFICCLSCLILYRFTSLSTHTHTHTHTHIQAAAPCSRKPSSGPEHLGEEGHQPDLGSGLRRQQPSDPLHPGGLREQ